MIDEILEAELDWSARNNKTVRIHTIKTAIYEIGLEVIGDPESEDDFPFTPGIKMSARNELRASQRKAWAKACGVAEK